MCSCFFQNFKLYCSILRWSGSVELIKIRKIYRPLLARSLIHNEPIVFLRSSEFLNFTLNIDHLRGGKQVSTLGRDNDSLNAITPRHTSEPQFLLHGCQELFLRRIK
jgi:hypothetical protein